MAKRLGRAEKALLAGPVLGVFVVVAWFSNDEHALAASMAVALFVSIIQTKAETRKESLRDPRFWGLIAALVAIHVAVLSLVTIPELRFGMMAAPFALVDGLLMWQLIEWQERRFLRPSTADVASTRETRRPTAE